MEAAESTSMFIKNDNIWNGTNEIQSEIYQFEVRVEEKENLRLYPTPL